MEKSVQLKFVELRSNNKDQRYHAFMDLIRITDSPVDWAYDVWNELIVNLTDKDNHIRAIASQILCNLAISDPEKRMLKDFEKVIAVTRDERFVTARHTLQSIWKIGRGGKEQREVVLEGLTQRFLECVSEKNRSLIRADIIKGLKNLNAFVEDPNVSDKALKLIALEENPKDNQKLTKLWRSVER